MQVHTFLSINWIKETSKVGNVHLHTTLHLARPTTTPTQLLLKHSRKFITSENGNIPGPLASTPASPANSPGINISTWNKIEQFEYLKRQPKKRVYILCSSVRSRDESQEKFSTSKFPTFLFQRTYHYVSTTYAVFSRPGRLRFS